MSETHHHRPVAWWRDDALIHRFVCDLIADDLSRQRPTSLIPPAGSWKSPDLHLVRDLAIDSLELVSLATALNEALHLHESGLEDRLLARHTIGDWIEVAREGLETFSGAMTFRTSGSAGVPKRCTHSVADLWQEVRELAPRFAGRRRVLSAVRTHHIYGFLWSTLLPLELALESDTVLDVRGSLPSSVAASLREGDLVIGYPDFWQMMARSGVSIASDVVGITSTAPCPDIVAHALTEQGLGSLVHIYGSSETAGVGVRAHPGEPYTLLSYWKRGEGGSAHIVRESFEGRSVAHSPQDTLLWTDDRRFRPTGRADDGIQVAGVNVFPSNIRRVLLGHPDVLDVAIRRMGTDESGRLKAFVVPRSTGSLLELQNHLEVWLSSRLSPPERPKAFTFGESIPLDPMGKQTDWLLA
ncbi:MAG: AMP-binding protein [Gemmatimonadaceae bacterium]